MRDEDHLLLAVLQVGGLDQLLQVHEELLLLVRRQSVRDEFRLDAVCQNLFE